MKKDDDFFLDIVICPKCKQKEFYRDMHWRDGETMCRKCIQKLWDKDLEKYYR